VAVEVDEEELAAQPKDAWSRMYADPVYEAANNRRRLQRPQGRSMKVCVCACTSLGQLFAWSCALYQRLCMSCDSSPCWQWTGLYGLRLCVDCVDAEMSVWES
jgi:hypothetical protein